MLRCLCESYKARHIQVNISARGVNPELFTESECWEQSALQILQLAEKFLEKDDQGDDLVRFLRFIFPRVMEASEGIERFIGNSVDRLKP